MREYKFVTSEGVSLNYGATTGTEPPIVLLHGVTRRWQDWLPFLPALTPRWRVLAIDLRGHGRSARVPDRYLVGDYVPDIVDFLRRELDEPAIIIGHSLGGNVAAAVAAQAPDRVRAVVLEDPPLEMAGSRMSETVFLALFRIYIHHAGSDRPIHEIANELAVSLVPTPGHRGLVKFGDIRDGVALRVMAAGLKQLDPEVLKPPLAGIWLEGSDVAWDLKRIHCPTLLLQADEAAGGLLPDSLAEEATTLIRDCTLLKLKGVGHNIHGSASDAMARLVVPFLGSLE